MKYENAAKYAIQYDALGEHKVKVLVDGNIEKIPDPEKALPRISNPDLDILVQYLWTISNDQHNKGRAIPLTVGETESFARTQTLKKLTKTGLISIKTIALVNKAGKNPGSRSCVIFTDEGRTYCKEYFKESTDDTI